MAKHIMVLDTKDLLNIQKALLVARFEADKPQDIVDYTRALDTIDTVIEEALNGSKKPDSDVD